MTDQPYNVSLSGYFYLRDGWGFTAAPEHAGYFSAEEATRLVLEQPGSTMHYVLGVQPPASPTPPYLAQTVRDFFVQHDLHGVGDIQYVGHFALQDFIERLGKLVGFHPRLPPEEPVEPLDDSDGLDGPNRP